MKKNYPKPPGDLDAAGLKAWDSVCADLESLGTLNKTDRKILEVYCRDYSLCSRVNAQLADEPLSMCGEKGRPFINPLVSTYTVLTTKLRQTLSELGLTPVARKAKATSSDEANPYAEMLSKGI